MKLRVSVVVLWFHWLAVDCVTSSGKYVDAYLGWWKDTKYMKKITYRNKEGMERLKQGQKVHCN
jgi:hypothetical protein